MHAVVATATLHDFERARQGLEQMVPPITEVPGFVTGYWTRSDDHGLSMIVFESEDAARQVAERIRSDGAPDPEAVTIDNVEVREVVKSA